VDRQTVSPTFSLSLAQAFVNALGTRPAAALAASLAIHLWKDPGFNPIPSTDTADFVTAEADYTGYAAAAAVTLTSPVNLNGNSQGAIGNALFTTSAPVTVPNTIYGYWLQSGSDVLMFERFASGQQVAIGTEGDFLNLMVALPCQYTQDGSS
jgi:hypothetical protein